MAAINNLIQFYHAGMDQDSAPIRIDHMDTVAGYNIRASGTSAGEDGYITNIESNIKIQGDLPAGINKVVGSFGFEQIRKAIWYIFNSGGNHQIGVLDYDTDILTIVFEDLTDTGGVQVLGLTPGNYVLDIKLINNDYLVWNDANAPVGFTNLTTLISGGYGTVLPEDFSLIKPQCLTPPTGVYGNDAGQPENHLFGNLPQFTVQYVTVDYTYSAWSTWSKRIVPYQQNTPSLGSNVTENNYIVVTVNIGSIRESTINIACRFGTFNFSTVKSVDRAYILALPNTAVDVSTEIYEAYDPTTNTYSFAFYNDDISIPVNPLETDLAYDAIPESAGALEVVNGDIIALGDLNQGYGRPATSVTVAAIGYNPNIAIPAGTFPDPLRATGSFPGESGSGAGDHKRIMSISLGGTPHTGDTIITIIGDIRNASATQNYSYQVPSGLDGDLAGVIAAYTTVLPSATSQANGDGTYTITFIGPSFYGLQEFGVHLFFAGASVANSIPTILDNTVYQLALSYFDQYGRYFPLDTDNTFSVTTPSYAQVSGNAIQIPWKINTLAAPASAVGYQWLITKAPITKVLDTIATVLNYKGTWNAATNSPSLAVNAGTVGDTWQITTPASPAVPTSYTNLGGNESYNTGDYIVYNGQSYDVLDKTFGDLTGTGNILAFSLNSLKMFNDAYAQNGVSTVLAYDFAQGDKCTLHYYLTGTTPTYINNPCVTLAVFGYDSGSYIVKMEKSATFDTSVLVGKNTFLRLYSPAQQDQTASAAESETVWFEIGEVFPVTNGQHSVLSGIITDGGAYYKTRQFDDALMPYDTPPVEVLATDLNYSDFYQSAFSSFGRPRSYSDELEKTERKAIITWSNTYVLGSKVNGLTRVYPENVYGTQGGETSANYGAIRKLLQVNNELVCIQQLNHGSIPVYQTVYIDQAQRTTVAVSEKLFNPIRYTTSKHIGCGDNKESISIYNNIIYWVDPNRSLPVRWEGDGCFPIGMKMTKYFKSTLQLAVSQGYKIIGWYDIFNDEYIMSVQQPGGVVSAFAFAPGVWGITELYTVTAAMITANNGTNSTVAYNNVTGIAIYTPGTNYVGNDAPVFSFNPGSGVINKVACLNWTAGSGNVNPFNFMELFGVPISTVEQSNSILVAGNDYPVPISITGGQYSINGGAFVSTPGTVSAGNTVRVQVTSSASFGTSASCTLTIDGQSATFTVVTRALGNFIASANYGMIIDSIVDNTGSGTPAAFNPCNLASGQSLAAAYTTFATGTYTITLDGSPVTPGHVYIGLSVNGVLQDHKLFSGGAIENLTNGLAATDPTVVEFFAFTMS